MHSLGGCTDGGTFGWLSGTVGLVGLGGVRVRTTEDESDYYAVMQDPEGNEFCVG